MTGLLPPVRTPAADRDLLRAFLADRSEPAFAELVRRHGPVVFGVCRRILGDRHDAEDAFQAAFLVLARKAADVRKPDALASWLYGVAYRTARELRSMRDRRRKKELGARSVGEGKTKNLADASGSELTAVLDEELARLPEHYRLAVVLCELHGRSRKQAATELGVPEGTLSSRLAMAKKLLAARLTKRGLAATVAAVSAVLASEASARVPFALTVGTARAALGADVSPAAATAAEGVIKELFVNKLKGLAVAVGVLVAGVGGLAMVSGGAGANPQPLARAADDPAKLVKQLGSANFAEREAAEKKLRELGVKALPAIKSGLADADPEVARRSAEVRAAITRDRLWAAFARVAGEDKPARDLFAAVMSSPRAVAAVEAALDDPTRADELYRDRTAELLRMSDGHPPVAQNGKPEVPDGPNSWGPLHLPPGDVAGWMLLGTLQPGTGPWQPGTHRGWVNRTSSSWPFLPEDDHTKAEFIAKEYEGPSAGPLKKLTAVWLLRRRENDALRAGLTLAIRYDIQEALATARNVLRQPRSAEIEPQNRAAAIVLVGLHGGKDDLPLLARHTADDRVFVIILDKSVKIGQFDRPVATDGRDLTCQVRDAAAVAMCKLAGRDPKDFGFPPFPAVKHPNGRPMALSSSTAIGFTSKAARDAAFAKAADWLKSFEEPVDEEKVKQLAKRFVEQLGSAGYQDREAAVLGLENLALASAAATQTAVRDGTTHPNAEIAARCKDLLPRLVVISLSAPTHPAWQRFEKLIGGDDASRKLYLEMTGDARRAEVVRAVEANPAKAAELYEAELKLRVAELTKGYEDSAERYKNFTGLVWPTSGIPTRGELAALLYLGTFPGTAKVTYKPAGQWDGTAYYNVFGLGLGLKPPLRQLDAEIPPALRRLFVAWLAMRDDPDMLRFGLGLAVNGNMTDILPAARAMAAKADLDAPTRGKAILAVGQYGTKEDTPLLEKALADKRDHWTSNFTDEKNVKHPVASQVRDIAAAAILKLHEKSLAEFGFTFIAKYKKDGPDVLRQSVWLTFMDNDAREAMHAKVKAWLATVK